MGEMYCEIWYFITMNLILVWSRGFFDSKDLFGVMIIEFQESRKTFPHVQLQVPTAFEGIVFMQYSILNELLKMSSV